MTPNDRKKLKAFDVGGEWFKATLPKTELAIYKRLVEIIDGLSTSGHGKLTFSQPLSKVMAQIEAAVRDNVSGGPYAKTLSDYLAYLPDLADVSAAASDAKVPKSLLSEPKAMAIETATQLLSEPNLRAQFTNPIKLYVRQAVTTGGTVEGLKKTLNQYVRGINNDGGRLARYVNTTAIDTNRALDGALQQVIADEFDLDAYEYMGSLLLDSREQCVHWVKKRIILISEIPKEVERWRNGSGYGYGLTLTTQNWPSVCGGYGCRHLTKAIRATQD